MSRVVGLTSQKTLAIFEWCSWSRTMTAEHEEAIALSDQLQRVDSWCGKSSRAMGENARKHPQVVDPG